VRRSTVADVVVDGLKRAGTPGLFAVAGVGPRHPLLDAARAGALPITLASGPSAACTMAAVAGDLVDAPGAAHVGGEGGPTAASQGVARAHIDRAPLIVLVDELPAQTLAGKASLGVTPESAGHWIAHAARLAATEPRGPVHLTVAPAVAVRPALPIATSCRADPWPAPDPGALDASARLLARAARPLLVAGRHCRAASVGPWIRALAEALPAPVLATLHGKGALPDPHPLTLGVLGAGPLGERLLERADLVVMLGLDDLELDLAPWGVTIPRLVLGQPTAPDDRMVAPAVAGDLAVVLEELAPRLRDRERADWDVAELDRFKRELAAGPTGDTRALDRRAVVRLVREATPAGTIATLDPGPHLADVVAAWHAVSPRELLTSSGPVGFAVPAAIAAHLVRADRRVVGFVGSDGVAASIAELETAARLGAPITLVAFIDGEPAAAEIMRAARTSGLTAVAVGGAAQFAAALGRVLREPGPALIAV
jgi:acetolactate synthase-1/2/3 large subunit